MRWARPTVRDALAVAIAAPWLVWAAVRSFGVEPAAPLTGALALTPVVAATSWFPLAIALALRRWAVAAIAALSVAALTAAVAPRALGGPQAALPHGRTLSLMTVNLRYGHGDPATVLRLAREHDVDVLSLQD